MPSLQQQHCQLPSDVCTSGAACTIAVYKFCTATRQVCPTFLTLPVATFNLLQASPCRTHAAAERTSLIPETLRDLQTEGSPSLLDKRAAKQAAAQERRARQRSLQQCNLPDFAERLQVCRWPVHK